MTPKQISNLTDDEIRVKIAEMIGWTDIQWEGDPAFPALLGKDKGGIPKMIPNYPYDLNAVHKVWINLNDEEKQRFWKALVNIIGSGRLFNAVVYSYRAAGATARQRCEALILTMEGGNQLKAIRGGK